MVLASLEVPIFFGVGIGVLHIFDIFVGGDSREVVFDGFEEIGVGKEILALGDIYLAEGSNRPKFLIVVELLKVGAVPLGSVGFHHGCPATSEDVLGVVVGFLVERAALADVAVAATVLVAVLVAVLVTVLVTVLVAVLAAGILSFRHL